MAKRFQRHSSSFTVCRAGCQRRFTLSCIIVTVKLLFKSPISSNSMFTGGFLILDSGQEQQPPATTTPLLKLSSQVFRLTNNLRARREREKERDRGKAGSRHLLLASEVSNQNTVPHWRAEPLKINPTNHCEGQVRRRNR